MATRFPYTTLFLSRSGPARLRGARPSSVNSRLACGGTIYDCRRGDLSLGRIAYRAGVRLERLPILACLVRAAFRPARGHSRSEEGRVGKECVRTYRFRVESYQ